MGLKTPFSFIVDENKNQGQERKSLAATLICILMCLDFAQGFEFLAELCEKADPCV